MTTMTLSEAAAAYAAARCLAARVRDPLHRITTDHPTTCGWCDYPTDLLDRMVRGFNELADYDRRNGTSASDAVAFDRLERDEQRRRVTAAQALSAPPAEGDGGSISSGLDVGTGPHGSRLSGDSGSNDPPGELVEPVEAP
ncbi:MAG TPA: hypothetical protein VN773_03850, partial [Verrucomicrobiae bacterium]|nr:hypothetical protein [Verrucomicrobiae bacterium]